jgi:hypothetical protein
MALLPDLAAAGLYAAVLFLLVLGFLVVFVETIEARRLALILAIDAASIVYLFAAGEGGLAVLAFGIGLAFIANHVFEWSTSR